MYQFPHTTKEYLDAVESLNQRQNEKNLFTEISDQDVFQEIKRNRKISAKKRMEDLK